jgi:hypothetical protein
MHTAQRLPQGRSVERLGQAGDLAIAGGGQQRHCAVIHPFQQQHTNRILGHARFRYSGDARRSLGDLRSPERRR